MLNIRNPPISIKRSSKALISNLKIADGGLNSTSWTRIKNSVKNEISEKLLWKQKYKCAYCERYLTGLAPEIDHFVPKALFSQFTFQEKNLFYSCRDCNSPSRKGQKPTIDNNPRRYSACSFQVINPLIHNPNKEILFSDADRIDFDFSSCTRLGKQTIDFFSFHDYEMTNIRSKQLIFERDFPNTRSQLKKLIQEAIAYK